MGVFQFQQFAQMSWLPAAIVALVLWVLPWKAVALWKAARNNDKAWFAVLLFVNTLAILEILYIFVFSKKKKKLQEVIHNALNI